MTANSDHELVAETLSGNREAFGQIVARYQSLICSLGYSATGNLTQSEDLAQETFLTAWKQMRALREPHKLRSWLCGIARNLIHNRLRRQQRDPAHDAVLLEPGDDSSSPGLMPHEQAINNEEEVILWRAVEQIPEIYREPLILFYREHHSIEKVAEALELSEDAVKQRLSRGRKLLHEQVLAFVEGALERTNPGKAFTIAVLAALPAFTISAPAATLGAAAIKGGASAKTAASASFVTTLLAPFLAFFGTWVGYRMSLDAARSEPEREFIKSFYRKLGACIVGFFVVFALLMLSANFLVDYRSPVFVGLIIFLAIAYAGATAALAFWSMRRRRQLVRELTVSETSADLVKPTFEYRSKLEIAGLPFVHVRIGGGILGQRKPIKAWIAAGDFAIGVLFAFGGMAVAPLCLGGFAIGLLPFGGCAIGLLTLGGFSVGVWTFGGLAVGWQAFGGCAIAWNASMGGAAVAHDFALGAFGHAAQANNQAAVDAIGKMLFFRDAQAFGPFVPWLNLLWIVPMLLWWRMERKARKLRGAMD